MRDKQAILLRASWLLDRAGYEESQVEVEVRNLFDDLTGRYKMVPGWVARREARPLPHRSQIEAEHRRR